MNTRLFNLSHSGLIALIVAVSLVVWSAALPALLYADDVSPGPVELQNILSDSAPGVVADHDISFSIATSSNGVPDTEEVVITYEEAGTSTNFTEIEDVVAGDITITVDGTGALSFASSDATSVTFNVDTALDPGDDVRIQIDGRIVNPDHTFDDSDPLSAITHIMNVAVTSEDSSDTRVAIIDDVTMTAAVDTIFEFSVGGLAENTIINDRNTTGSTTPTSIDFGTIDPDEFYFLGHELTVETNASNGFVVTVQESQELTSSTGEIIHRFQDTVSGAEGQTDPIAWASPAGDLDNFETYGHYGITTDDETLNDRTGVATDDDFTTTTDGGFVGNFNNDPRPVFGHTDAADGSTQNFGVAKVGVGIEITSLQAAGDDYTTTLTYVATPTF